MKSRRFHFYLRFVECNAWELSQLSERLRPIGTVRDSGLGTAKSPKSGWVELHVRDWINSIPALRQQLKLLNFPDDAVPEIVEIDRGEGKTQAKQLDLFSGAS